MIERGYNQSELIGKEISKIQNIPIAKNILYKYKNTKAQSTLNKEQRDKNVKNVYKCRNMEEIVGKKILIIDDIYTTGNTVNECARILNEHNIKKEDIGVLTIAKD